MWAVVVCDVGSLISGVEMRFLDLEGVSTCPVAALMMLADDGAATGDGMVDFEVNFSFGVGGTSTGMPLAPFDFFLGFSSSSSSSELVALFSPDFFAPFFVFVESSSTSISSSSPLSFSSSSSSGCSFSTVKPSQRPPSSPSRRHDHIGRLTLELVLILKLWTLSQPPLMCLTTAGIADWILARTCAGLWESVLTLIELRSQGRLSRD